MKFKDLFSTPKKIVTTLGITVISIGVLSSVSLFTVYAIAETNSVGKDTAVKNAYAAAGITESEVDAVDVDFKFKDGKFVYDVEFYYKGKEYEYKIHSKNGCRYATAVFHIFSAPRGNKAGPDVRVLAALSFCVCWR